MAQPIVVHTFQIPIHVGSFQFNIAGFGIAVLLAFVIAQIVSEHELLRRGHDFEAKHVADVLFAALIGTMIGGKVYYVTIITHDWHQLLSRSGFVYWGGFIGAVLGCLLFIRAKGWSFPRYADVGAIAIAAGYAVGRTGCWAVGDDYGKWYTGPLAVAFPEGTPPTTVGAMTREFHAVFPPDMDPNTVVSVIPTQLVEVALGMVMFGILWRLRRHVNAEGWLFGVYLLLAGIERFLVEFLRIKDDRFFALSVAQCIALALGALGLVVMQMRKAQPSLSVSTT